MKRKKDGIVVTNASATPLQSGMHSYWEAHWKNLVLSHLSDSHPNVEVEYDKQNNGFRAVFRKDDRSGREMCGTSRSLENSKVTIPEPEIDSLVAALDSLHKEAENADNTDGARWFAREYRVPDPRQMRSAWRVGRSGRFKKLLLLWGYHPSGAVSDVILPLTPTSKDWEDAKRRVDLKEVLREAGRIGKSSLDWGWIISRSLFGLLLLALIALLAYGIGCDAISDKFQGYPNSGRSIDRKGLSGIGSTESGDHQTTRPPSEHSGQAESQPNHPRQQNAARQEKSQSDDVQTPEDDSQGAKSRLGDEQPEDDSQPEKKELDDVQSSVASQQDNVQTPEDDSQGAKSRLGDEQSEDDSQPEKTELDDVQSSTASQQDNVQTPDDPQQKKTESDDVRPTDDSQQANSQQDDKSNLNETPPVIIPDFIIRLEDKGDNGDGSFSPSFGLVAQYNLPENSVVQWTLDGEEVTDSTAQHMSYKPHFPDDSPHEIVANIRIANSPVQKTPPFVWNPNAGSSGEYVRRFIEQIGVREDSFGTFFRFDVGSDPQDGKVSVRSWHVEKVEPSKRILEWMPGDCNTNVIQIHSKDIAGNAKIEITAKILVDGKGEQEVRGKRIFGVSSGDTSDSISSTEAQQLLDVGKGIVPSVYLVVTPTGTGTAFSVSKRELITNRHVVEGAYGRVKLYASRSTKPLQGRVNEIDEKSDLALIEILDNVEMTGLALAEAVSPHQAVSCVGFSVPALNAEKLPNGGCEPTISSGILDGYNPWAETAFSDLKSFHGNSGSPVVNEQGKVVGVVFAGTGDLAKNNEIDEQSHRSCLVTLRMLKGFLESNGVQ